MKERGIIMTARDTSADTTLNNANEGIMNIYEELKGEDAAYENGLQNGKQSRQPEIDALKARAEGAEKRLKEMVDHNIIAFKNSRIAYVNLQAETESLRAEVARLKADAERLSWLEAHPRLGEIYVNGEAKDCYLYAVSGALGAPLRAIIDAAMSALPDTKGE